MHYVSKMSLFIVSNIEGIDWFDLADVISHH